MRILTVLLLLMAAVGYFAYQNLLQAPQQPGEAKIFEVKKGETGRQIIDRLDQEGLIKSKKAFYVYARLTGMAGRIRVGEYEVSTGLSALDLVNKLASGKSVERALTVQEGINLFEIADLYEASGFGKKRDFINLVFDKALIRSLLGEDIPCLEGYLFPDTYHLDKYAGPRKLIEEMVQNFLKNYQEVVGAANLPNGMTRHQFITFASMVEKETGAAEERPVIASVFYNRLKKGMRLQSDPTIIYGMARRTGSMPLNIRKADILTPSPFNTYTVEGLPHGPIANPGKESLKAALKPATSEYLYFVSRNNGTHVFTTNYKDHNKAVTEWQRTRANREGKSWRDRAKAESSRSGAKN